MHNFTISKPLLLIYYLCRLDFYKVRGSQNCEHYSISEKSVFLTIQIFVNNCKWEKFQVNLVNRFSLKYPSIQIYILIVFCFQLVNIKVDLIFKKVEKLSVNRIGKLFSFLVTSSIVSFSFNFKRNDFNCYFTTYNGFGAPLQFLKEIMQVLPSHCVLIFYCFFHSFVTCYVLHFSFFIKCFFWSYKKWFFLSC